MPEQTNFPTALFQLKKGPISVGLTSLRALQLSGYSWIEALIYLFQVSCKNTVCFHKQIALRGKSMFLYIWLWLVLNPTDSQTPD